MSVVELNEIPAMAQAVEGAIQSGEPFGPAIEPFVRVESFPTRLRPVETFLKSLDVTIYIGDEGPCYMVLPADKIVMPDPGRLPLDTWNSVALHEFLHWTEWRTAFWATPDVGELRAEIGQAVLERLLKHPFDIDLKNYWKWHPRWLARIDSDPESVLHATQGAIQGVELLVNQAADENVWTPERIRINAAFEKLLAHVRKSQQKLSA